MAITDEPAYMLQARAYARNGLGKLSTGTVAALLARIGTLEAENRKLQPPTQLDPAAMAKRMAELVPPRLNV